MTLKEACIQSLSEIGKKVSSDDVFKHILLSNKFPYAKQIDVSSCLAKYSYIPDSGIKRLIGNSGKYLYYCNMTLKEPILQNSKEPNRPASNLDVCVRSMAEINMATNAKNIYNYIIARKFPDFANTQISENDISMLLLKHSMMSNSQVKRIVNNNESLFCLNENEQKQITNVKDDRTQLKMTLKDAILKSLEDINIEVSASSIYYHIVKNKYFDFTIDKKISGFTIYNILDECSIDDSSGIKRIYKGEMSLYYLTKKEQNNNITKATIVQTTPEIDNKEVIDISGQNEKITYTKKDAEFISWNDIKEDEKTPHSKYNLWSDLKKEENKLPSKQPIGNNKTVITNAQNSSNDNYKLGEIYKDKLGLKTLEALWLNKFGFIKTDFLSIEGCCIATIYLYLRVLTMLNKIFKSNETTIALEVQRFKNYIFKEIHRYDNENIEAAIFLSIFKKTENRVRECYQYKDKVVDSFNYDVPFGFESIFNKKYESIFGDSINNILESQMQTILKPDNATLRDLAQNTLKWKDSIKDNVPTTIKDEKMQIQKMIHLDSNLINKVRLQHSETAETLSNILTDDLEEIQPQAVSNNVQIRPHSVENGKLTTLEEALFDLAAETTLTDKVPFSTVFAQIYSIGEAAYFINTILAARFVQIYFIDCWNDYLRRKPEIKMGETFLGVIANAHEKLLVNEKRQLFDATKSANNCLDLYNSIYKLIINNDFSVQSCHKIYFNIISENKNKQSVYNNKEIKKINLDIHSINEARQQHSETLEALSKILTDDEEEISRISFDNTLVPESNISNEQNFAINNIIATLRLNENQIALLHFFKGNGLRMTNTQIDDFAKTHHLFKGQLVDSINEICYEILDDILIEETENVFSITQDYYSKIIPNG